MEKENNKDLLCIGYECKLTAVCSRYHKNCSIKKDRPAVGTFNLCRTEQKKRFAAMDFYDRP